MNIKVEKKIIDTYELNVGDVVTFPGDVSRGEWNDKTEKVVYITPNAEHFVYLSNGYPITESTNRIYKINGKKIRD